MADRVLSTGEARQAITSMRNIINSGLLEQIQQLSREGETLSRPDVWDGRLATQFRGDWPTVMSTLRETQTKLEELRQQVDQINQNIMTAGGNT